MITRRHLKPMLVDSFMLLEAESLKSLSLAKPGVSAGLCFLQRLSGRIPVFALGLFLPSSEIAVWHRQISLSLSAEVFPWPSLLFAVKFPSASLFVGTLMITFRAHLDNPD